MNVSPTIEIHQFDGKLDPRLFNMCHVVTENKNNVIMLKLHLTKKANIILDKILNDWSNPANYDPVSGLRVEKLLTLCVMLLLNKDFVQDLNIQLEDMHTGLCEIGRITRIYQLLLSYIN